MKNFEVIKNCEAMAATEHAAPRMAIAFKTPDGSVMRKLFFHQPLGLDFERCKEPIVIRHVFRGSYASAICIREGWVIVGVEGQSVAGMCYDDVWKHMAAAAMRLPWGNRAVVGLEAPDGSVDERTFFHRPLSIAVTGESLSELSFVIQGMRAVSVNGDSLSELNFVDAWNRLKAAEERLDQEAKMEIGFVLPDGSRKELAFCRRPLGCKIGPKLPLFVKTVDQGTSAASMGVQAGWIIRTVNGEDLTGRDFDYSFLQILQAEHSLQEAKGVDLDGTVTTDDSCQAHHLHALPDVSRASTVPPSACGSTVPKMILGFKDKSGDLKHKTFFHQPLGLDFEKTMPIVIKDVFKNGYAESLGVRVGWEVVDVDWKLLEHKTYEDAWQLLCDASTPLPHGRCVAMSFLTTRGARQEKTFFHGPFGIEFQAGQSPLVVGEVRSGSHSQSVGVRPSWQVISLNGKSLASMTFQEAHHLVRVAEQTLEEVAKLDLDFELPDGSHRELTFHTRPLGCEIKPTVPLTVKHVSHDTFVARAGVKAGWIVRAINGEDITSKDFGSIFNMLRMAECILPWEVDSEAEHNMQATLQAEMPHKASAPSLGHLHPQEASPQCAQMPLPAPSMHKFGPHFLLDVDELELAAKQELAAEQELAACAAEQAAPTTSSSSDNVNAHFMQASDPDVDVGNGHKWRLISLLMRPVGRALDTLKLSRSPRYATAGDTGTLRTLRTSDGGPPGSTRRVAKE